MPLSHLDLPRIIEAIEELVRTIEHPPTADWQAPAWLVAQCAPRENPAWLVALGGAIMDEAPPLIQGLNDHAWLLAQCESWFSTPINRAHGWLIEMAVSEVLTRTMGPEEDCDVGDCPEGVSAATWAPWFTDSPEDSHDGRVFVGDGPETAESLDIQRRMVIVRGSREPRRADDCHEIAESSLDMRHKIALVDLRKYLFRCEIVQILAANGIDRLQALVYLGSVIEVLTDRAPNAAVDAPPEDANKPALSKEEREVKVRDYLKSHKVRASAGELSIREIKQETGVPIPSIQRVAAWRALQDRLEKEGLSKRPRRRKAQAFTSAMDSVAEDVQKEKLTAKLTAEQAADDEGSPLDKGRRGKVRVQKRF